MTAATTIGFSMPMFLRRNAHPIRWVLLVAFSLGLSANCLATASMTETEKACCAAMAKGCDTQPAAQSCCTTETPRVDQSAAAARVTAPSPAHVDVIALIDPPAVTARVATGTARDRDDARPPGIPPLLLNSLLRV